MPEHYQHLGVYSDWVDAAQRQAPLFPIAAAGRGHPAARAGDVGLRQRRRSPAQRAGGAALDAGRPEPARKSPGRSALARAPTPMCSSPPTLPVRCRGSWRSTITAASSTMARRRSPMVLPGAAPGLGEFRALLLRRTRLRQCPGAGRLRRPRARLFPVGQPPLPAGDDDRGRGRPAAHGLRSLPMWTQPSPSTTP